MRAKPVLTALAAAALMAACTLKKTPLVNTGEVELDGDKWAVMFVLERDSGLLQTPFTLTIRPYDPETMMFTDLQVEEESENGWVDEEEDEIAAAPDTAIKVRYAANPQLGRNDRYWTYVLPEGHYAIESAEITKTYTQVQMTGGDPLIGLAVMLTVAAVSDAAAEINHEEIRFADGTGKLTPDAPRFTVTAGKATYIGDFGFRSEARQYTQVEYTDVGPNSDAVDAKERTLTDLRVKMGYSFVPEGVAWYAGTRGFEGDALLEQPIENIGDKLFLVKDFSNAEVKRRTLPRAPSLTGKAPGS